MFRRSGSVWWVMYSWVVDVFSDTPAREPHDPPSTSFWRGAAGRRKHIYRKQFTPAGEAQAAEAVGGGAERAGGRAVWPWVAMGLAAVAGGWVWLRVRG